MQIVPEDEVSLVALAIEANDEHGRAISAVSDALYHMKKSGEALLDAHGRLADYHGGSFLQWINQNFEGSTATAYRYMTLVPHYDEVLDRLAAARAKGKRLSYQRVLREITDRESGKATEADLAEQAEAERFLGGLDGTATAADTATTATTTPINAPSEPKKSKGKKKAELPPAPDGPTVSVDEVAERQQEAIERDEVYLWLTALEALAKLRTLEKKEVVEAILAYEYRDSMLEQWESLDPWLHGVIDAVRARLRKTLTVVGDHQ